MTKLWFWFCNRVSFWLDDHGPSNFLAREWDGETYIYPKSVTGEIPIHREGKESSRFYKDCCN